MNNSSRFGLSQIEKFIITLYQDKELFCWSPNAIDTVRCDSMWRLGERPGISAPWTQPATLAGRNYAVLAQLLTLSGDRQGARSAFQSCVANLQRAQDAGDISQGTADTMRHCQAGL